MFTKPACRLLATMALACAAAQPALAQKERSGGGASAQLMQQMQQLASERTALQAENTKLKTELEKLRKESEGTKKSQDAVEQRGRASQAALARSASDKERVEADLTREKERLQELVGRFRETATTLRDVETDRSAVKLSLAQREQELKACVDRNAKLYDLNKEVLAKLEDQGFLSALARKEPFTQLKRVQLENLVDDYRGKAQDQLVTPGALPQAATPPPGPP